MLLLLFDDLQRLQLKHQAVSEEVSMSALYLLVLVEIAQWCALNYQFKYNRLHKSIFGLSFDMQWLLYVHLSLQIFITWNYKSNWVVVEQLQNRFPIFYHEKQYIPISWGIFIVQLAQWYRVSGLVRQLYTYWDTIHIHQGVSVGCAMILLIFVGVGGVTTWWFAWWFGSHRGKDSGLLGIFWLDHINYLWLISNILRMTYLWPQISINWMGQCCRGVSSRFIVISTLTTFFKIIFSHCLSKSEPWYLYPVNLSTQLVNVIEFLSLLIILFQVQYLYLYNKPYLKRKSLRGLSASTIYSKI